MWNGVVTNLGLSLLEQWAAGSETLYIDKATAGSGTVAQSNMRGSTYVQGEVGDVSIVASIPVTGGTQYRIQVSANPNAAYVMHQIGIWAHLGASGGTTLLALYQDEDGVSVPLEADDPGFGFTLYAVVSMSNQGSVSVNFDGGAYVTRDDFSSALAGYVKTVNENGPNSDGNVTLPVDAVPTNGSTNPVSSDGVFDALAGKQATLTFDSTPTSGSTNPVTSGGVYTALDGKQDKLTLPLAIAQGGTGATTAAAALTNLGAASSSTVGIVATGTTAPQAITAGQYVIWQGSLYTAKSNIASGATLSTSNLTAVSSGGLNDLASKIGSNTNTGSPSNVTCANNTATNLNSITLSPGSYIIICVCTWASNATGYRAIGIATNDSDIGQGRYGYVRVAPANGVATGMQLVAYYKLTSTTTLYLNGIQTSGGNLAAIPGMNAIRVGI